MATETTTYLELSQWDGTDLFTRIDFNEDNQKIDTAFHRLDQDVSAIPAVVIHQVRAASDTASLTLNVSSVDFSRYLYTELVVIPATSRLYAGYGSIGINGATSGYKVSANGAGAVSAACLAQVPMGPSVCAPRILRFMPYSAEEPVTCVYDSVDLQDTVSHNVAWAGTTWYDLSSINWTSPGGNELLPTGSAMYLIGMKNPLR